MAIFLVKKAIFKLLKKLYMNRKIIILPLLVLILFSCGKNKREFQKVFDHYSKPEDSLKYKAAEFLIENMKYHYSWKLDNQTEVDEFFQTISKQTSIPSDTLNWRYKEFKRARIDKLIADGFEAGKISKPKYRTKKDLSTITADYLIENIDYAFKAWEFPWAREYSFDDFCKYILPYRYGNEVPSSWRKLIFEKYEWIADSLKNANSLEAAVLINKQFQSEFTRSSMLQKKRLRLKTTSLIENGISMDCFDQAGLGVCIMRALGVPATIIKIPLWGKSWSGHETIGIFNLDHKWTTFNLGGVNEPQMENKQKAAKMYMKRYDKMNKDGYSLIDVTSKLMNPIDLEVEINANEEDEVFLCVFGDRAWTPIFKGINKGSKALFKDVRNSKTMFLATTKVRGKLKAVSPVFSSDTLGNITYYNPDYSNKFSKSLNRKAHGLNGGFSRIKDLIGSKFTIANTKDFENEEQLYEVDTLLEYRNNIVEVPKKTGKFVKYEFPKLIDNSNDGPAEIAFYKTRNGNLEKIQGKYYSSSQLTQNQIDILTDGNLLSFVKILNYREDINIDTENNILALKDEPIWVAMELNTTETITHISICPRNDMNGVYPGMQYELFYWDFEWISLGKKIAKDFSITYDGIPENAILWLRNLDEGKEERIFTLVGGEQIWW